MFYLLDTNVLSELRNRKRCDPAVAKWQKSIDETVCFLSVISLTEIRKGINKIEKSDQRFADHLERWLSETLKGKFGGRTILVDPEIAEEAGRILALRTRTAEDALIAATAKVYDLTLVTRNVADFEGLGLHVLNPWEEGGA